MGRCGEGEPLADLVTDLPIDLAQHQGAFLGRQRLARLSDQDGRLEPDLLDRSGCRLAAVLPDRGAHGVLAGLKPVVAGEEAAVRVRRGLTGGKAANSQKAGGQEAGGQRDFYGHRGSLLSAYTPSADPDWRATTKSPGCARKTQPSGPGAGLLLRKLIR